MSKVTVVGDVRVVIDKVHQNAKKALRMIGMTVEGRAKSLAPVDTGLLRNSITYALGGSAPAATSYANNSGGNAGEYAGEADEDGAGELSVTIGTNVSYAAYQELGHHTRNGKWVAPQAFLRPAMESSMDDIKRILETELKPD